MDLNMKKIVITSLIVMLCGCSAPQPAKVDMKAPSIYPNVILTDEYVVGNRVPLNPQEVGRAWAKQYKDLGLGGYISGEQKISFFYVAHHADEVIILGHLRRSTEFKHWLIDNGVRAEIIVIEDVTKRADLVDILLIKRKGNRK
jgi:hypothetical protein